MGETSLQDVHIYSGLEINNSDLTINNGGIYAENALFNENVFINGTLRVEQDARLIRNVNIDQDLYVSGNTTISGNVWAKNGLNISGDVYINNQLLLSGKTIEVYTSESIASGMSISNPTYLCFYPEP
jgi:predicted acyltransferase (DUF342 family)